MADLKTNRMHLKHLLYLVYLLSSCYATLKLENLENSGNLQVKGLILTAFEKTCVCVCIL